ncbi:uncharacterized protein [Anabrus simplex]|uniref:uncharacterized protein n=1 Tax=Anabrus simplex TaxID=316456 RepID=UPI0035A33FE1
MTSSARAFWEERVAKEQVKPRNGTIRIEDQLAEMTRRLPGDSPVWNNIYCTIRDRRRSRSRTPSSSVVRSRTPSSVSSGRTTPTTPSPGPQFRMTSRTLSEEVLSTSSEMSRSSSIPHLPSKFQTKCWLEPRPVPIHYSSTVLMKLGSTRKRFTEEVTFQTRLVPCRFSEGVVKATVLPTRHYTSVLEIECQPPTVHVINLEQPEINGVHDVV